jgi:hypothetical protein
MVKVLLSRRGARIADLFLKGYPPSDKQVRRYFLGDWDTPEPNVSPDEIYIRSCAFLASLFDVTQQWMKETAASEPQPEVATGSNECFAAKFRALMTEGTTFGKHCAFRTKFYDDTVAGAEKVGHRSLLLFPGVSEDNHYFSYFSRVDLSLHAETRLQLILSSSLIRTWVSYFYRSA